MVMMEVYCKHKKYLLYFFSNINSHFNTVKKHCQEKYIAENTFKR